MSDEVKLEFIDDGVRVSDASEFELAHYSREAAWDLREKLNAAAADGRLTKPLSREFRTIIGRIVACVSHNGVLEFADTRRIGRLASRRFVAWLNAWAERGVFEGGES